MLVTVRIQVRAVRLMTAPDIGIGWERHEKERKENGGTETGHKAPAALSIP